MPRSFAYQLGAKHAQEALTLPVQQPMMHLVTISPAEQALLEHGALAKLLRFAPRPSLRRLGQAVSASKRAVGRQHEPRILNPEADLYDEGFYYE